MAVEKEIDRVINKFTAINEHSSQVIGDVVNHILELKNHLEEGELRGLVVLCLPDCDKQLTLFPLVCILISGPAEAELTPGQKEILKSALATAKEKLLKLTTDHRDLHGTVSKVGKAIDRNFESEYTATTRSDVFSTDRNSQLLNSIIAQHFYRQGMEDVAKQLIQVRLKRRSFHLGTFQY